MVYINASIGYVSVIASVVKKTIIANLNKKRTKLNHHWIGDIEYINRYTSSITTAMLNSELNKQDWLANIYFTVYTYKTLWHLGLNPNHTNALID